MNCEMLKDTLPVTNFI